MHCGFLILIQLVILQAVVSKEILRVNKEPDHHHGAFFKELEIYENKERSIVDTWNNIRNSAKNAWNSIKIIVQNTKEKIKNWVQNVKDRAIAIKNAFEKRLKTLQSNITSIIQNISENENIKKCFQDESEAINAILMDIVKKVTTCISNKLGGLAALEDNKKLEGLLNDTKFMENIDARLNKCKQNREDIEQCLENVRDVILKETVEIEDEVLKTRQISRGFADDILDAVISCSTEGLIEASAAIVNEIVVIITCIAQAP